jgi:hypothetical protein
MLKVIRKETNSWNIFLFNLLSITYDASSITKIRDNIESGTVESVNNALEMIDLVIDESIKAKFVSLIDVGPDEDKLKNLHQFYPGEIPQYDNLIEDILNRDYNLISIWAKAVTLRNMNSIQGENLRQSVLALLFSPEKILQEEAATLISRSDRSLLSDIIKRVPDGSGNMISQIVSGGKPAGELLFEKVKFLSGLFKEIPEDELIFLAGLMRYSDASDFRATGDHPDSIIWNLRSDYSVAGVSSVFESKLSEHSVKEIPEDSFFYIISVTALEEFRKMYPENSFEVFNYLDKQENNSL